MFGGCMAYRFFAFVPIALAGATADAMALSEFGFRFKGKFVEGAKASTGALFPASESPRSLTDNNPVAVDQFQLGTSNDCTARDPVRWLILASPARGAGWVVLNEQRRTSFIMPLERSTFANFQDLALLRQAKVRGMMYKVVIQESTKVYNALNEITVNITVVDAKTLSPIAPPIGTTFVVAGLVDGRTPRSENFRIHSKSIGPADDLDTPAFMPAGIWKSSRVEVLVGACLENGPIVVKFWLLNPLEPFEDLETKVTEKIISVSASLPLDVDTVAVPTTVLSGGVSAKLVKFQVFEANSIAGKLNKISCYFTFNAPPMKGTILRIRNFQNSISLSDPKLPVTWELESGKLVTGEGNYNRETGHLSTEMPVDSSFLCFPSGVCQLGTVVKIHFNLYNPKSLQEPLTLVGESDFCPLPSRIGCNSETFVELGPILGDDDGVLGGFSECEAPETEGESPESIYDDCGVCQGDNTLCQGCDGVPNSRKVPDTCGVCGGESECKGCDGVEFSGLQLDRCGVCNGTNACENGTSVVTPISINWPYILLNLTIVNAPGRAQLRDQEIFFIKEAVASVVDVVPVSVDILSILDAPVGKRLEEDLRRHLPPSHLVVRNKRERMPGEGACTAEKAEWAHCDINEGEEAYRETLVESWRLQALRGGQNSLPEARRRLLQIGGDPPSTGVIDVLMRINFGKDETLLEKAVVLEQAILDGRLAQALTDRNVCEASEEACVVYLFDPIEIKLLEPLVLDEPPPPPAKDDFILVVTIVSSILGVLVLCGCILCVRWRGLVKERGKAFTYRLSDLMSAEERGTAEAIKRAPPSTFEPPEGYEVMTIDSRSEAPSRVKSWFAGRGSKLPSAEGSFKKTRRRWLTGQVSATGGGTTSVENTSRVSSMHGSQESNVVGYLTQEAWPPKREEPSFSASSPLGPGSFGGSRRVKKKVLGPRDREALFAQAFPEEGNQAMTVGDIFEEPVAGAPSNSSFSRVKEASSHRLEPSPMGRGPMARGGSFVGYSFNHPRELPDVLRSHHSSSANTSRKSSIANGDANGNGNVFH